MTTPDVFELLRYNAGHGAIGRVAAISSAGVFITRDSFAGVFEPGLVVVASAYLEGPVRSGRMTVASRVVVDSGFVRTADRPSTGIPVLAVGDYLFVEGAAP